MENRFKLIVFLLIFIFCITSVSAAIFYENDSTIYECGVIQDSGFYELNQSFSDNSGNCMYFFNDSIVFNMNGFNISTSDFGNGDALSISSSDNITIANGTISKFGLGLDMDDNENITVRNLNIINCSNDANDGAIDIEQGFDLIFENITISNSSNYGIHMVEDDYGNNITFTNVVVKSTKLQEIFIETTGLNDEIHNITLLNVSLEKNHITLKNASEGAVMELIRKWYVDVKVNNSQGNLENAQVNITNSTDYQYFNGLTNSNGDISQQIVTEFITLGTNITLHTSYETPHTIVTNFSGYITNTTTYNLTQTGSINHDIVLSQDPSLTSCLELIDENTIYTLQNNLTSTGTCFTISENNITLHMNGYNITGEGGGSDNGIYINGYNNLTVYNGTIDNFGDGIEFDNSNYAHIYNISFIDGTKGVYMSDSDYGNFSDLYFYSQSSSGINMIDSSDNLFENITIESSNSYAVDMSAGGSTDNNILRNINVTSSTGMVISGNNNSIYNFTGNSMVLGDIVFIYSTNSSLNGAIIKGTTGGTYGSIILMSATDTDIRNVVINGSDKYGLYIGLGLVPTPVNSNNTFTNIIINNTSDNHIYFETDNAGSQALNNTFLNCTFDSSDVSFNDNTDGGDMELIRKWYYRAYVNDSNSGLAIQDANITTFNETSDFNFNLTTDVTGYTPRTEIIDFIAEGTTYSPVYYSNYTIYVNNESYLTQEISYNVTLEQNNLEHIFSFDNLGPNITLLGPSDNSEDTDGIVNFNYNLTDYNDVSNCSIYLNSKIITSTDINKSLSSIEFKDSNIEITDNLFWYVSCTDTLNNIGNSFIRNLDTLSGGSGDPAGGGVTGDTDTETNSAYLPGEGASDSNNDGDYTDALDDFDGDGITNEDDLTPFGSVVTSTGGTTGSSSTSEAKVLVDVLAIKTPVGVETTYDSQLDRAKIFKALFSVCGGESDGEIVECFITGPLIDEIDNLLSSNYGMNMETEEVESWIESYNDYDVESVRISELDANSWSLVSRELKVSEVEFSVNPLVIDDFFLAFKDTYTKQVTSNKILLNTEILSGMGFSTEIVSQGSAILTYKMPKFPADKIFSVVNGEVSYTSVDGTIITRKIQLRVISVRSKNVATFGLQFYQAFILDSIIIISILLYVFRKKIFKKKN